MMLGTEREELILSNPRSPTCTCISHRMAGGRMRCTASIRTTKTPDTLPASTRGSSRLARNGRSKEERKFTYPDTRRSGKNSGPPANTAQHLSRRKLIVCIARYLVGVAFNDHGMALATSSTCGDKRKLTSLLHGVSSHKTSESSKHLLCDSVISTYHS